MRSTVLRSMRASTIRGPVVASVRPSNLAHSQRRTVAAASSAVPAATAPASFSQLAAAHLQQQEVQQEDGTHADPVVALLTATGADCISTLPTPQRPLYQPERFEQVYEIGEVLGNGTYGVVRTCTHRATGQPFAVKILQRRRNKVDRTAAIDNEAMMAYRVRWCRSVARTYAVHVDTYSIFIVQELLIGGSLQTLLDAQGKLTEQEAAAALFGVLDALVACHDEGICYGDVKPANFMLASFYPSVLHLADPTQPKGALDIRMVDFGCAQACPDECSLEGLSGTPVYMAPEVAAGHQYGPASDLWGVGVMLYQLLTGLFPYWDCGLDTLRTMPTRQVLADVRSGVVMLDTASCAALSPDARDLLARLLERDPERRISAHDALRHPWMVAHGFGPRSGSGAGAGV